MDYQQQLLYPLFFYLLYFAALVFYNFKARVRAIKAGELSHKYYKDFSDKASVPKKLLILERHIDNQMQLPVVFMVSCVACLAMHRVDALTVILAWLFVVTRMIHSYIHLGSNNVIRRATAYGAGGLVLFIMWVKLILGGV